MGYTHYWYRPLKLGASTFALFADDCRKLALACEIPIAFEYDAPNTPPHFGGDTVQFNGIDEDGHETFVIPQVFDPPSWRPRGEEDGTHFDFCKTARKPYDVLVGACLIALKHHFGDAVKVSSDGAWEAHDYEWNGKTYHAESDWDGARYLYKRVFPDRDVDTSILQQDIEAAIA